jgi:hypothetical protein
MPRHSDKQSRPLLAPRVSFAWALWIALLVAPAALLVRMSWPALTKNPPLAARIAIIAILVAMLPTGLITRALLARRLTRRLVAQADAICLRCHYPLDGDLPGARSNTRCPECGQAFDLPATRDAWRRWREREFESSSRG